MVQVDPEDDSIRRYVVRHCRFDPVRRERRHVVVAAFDNEREYRRCLDATAAEISGRKQAGAADKVEHASGAVLEPGYAWPVASATVVLGADAESTHR